MRRRCAGNIALKADKDNNKKKGINLTIY